MKDREARSAAVHRVTGVIELDTTKQLNNNKDAPRVVSTREAPSNGPQSFDRSPFI